MKFLFTILILVTIWTHGHADGKKYYPAPEPTTTIQTITTIEECRGESIAMAMSGHQFDFATNALQLSLSGATWRGCDALAFGGATKLSERLLINGSGGVSAGEWAGVVSITMRF